MENLQAYEAPLSECGLDNRIVRISQQMFRGVRTLVHDLIGKESAYESMTVDQLIREGEKLIADQACPFEAEDLAKDWGNKLYLYHALRKVNLRSEWLQVWSVRFSPTILGPIAHRNEIKRTRIQQAWRFRLDHFYNFHVAQKRWEEQDGISYDQICTSTREAV